jgi:hypothetical protein
MYQYENMRFICSITRQKDIDTLTTNLKNQYPFGEMKYKTNYTANKSHSKFNFLRLIKSLNKTNLLEKIKKK